MRSSIGRAVAALLVSGAMFLPTAPAVMAQPVPGTTCPLFPADSVFNADAMRPIGWTSADAAGLPMAPLLLRPDEILAGSITHAIRLTTHCTGGYIWPGSHNAGSCDTNFPPMGARFRLRGTFDISGFSANTQVVLRAFQHYGLLLADNGADWYFGGTTDNWWGTTAGDTVVSELKTIPAAQFDAVDESGMQAAAGSYASISCTGKIGRASCRE